MTPASIDPQDRQFLDRLNRRGGGTVRELCGELGVTATAVRQRLVRLEARRLIERETVRHGRGRPKHVYRVNEAGQRELGDNYTDLAQILWRELQRIEDIEVRRRIVQRIEDALVQRYGTPADAASGADGSGADGTGAADASGLPSDLPRRLERLRDAMVERGFHVEVDATGELPILREHLCPYLDLAAEDPSICELERDVFRRVLGTEVRLTQCCLDGHHCCEFEPVARE
jgi:predicted ArsR family transcriptional regulator